MNKRIWGLFLCVALLLGLAAVPTAAKEEDTPLAIAAGIIAWKKADNGAPLDGYLINEKYLEQAGTTPGDWYPIALGRLNIADNNAGYLAVIKDQIEERYAQPGRLSAAKATEWHRMALAVLAMGGDPTAIGRDTNGEAINLIADGTYDRGKTTPLGRQGINGWIWGLIALDSMRYTVPEGAYNTREDMIVEILRQQLADGGFALSGKTADPDITAMAVQALAPYVNDEKAYVYTQKTRGETVSKTVGEAVDEALLCLSAQQLDTGDFKSWGTENVESTDQVVVALCCLGIDPLSDGRFIKNGHTLLDGILRYRMPDGGFVHSFTYDPDNPTSLPDASNTMASEQTLYTMAALWRQQNGMRTLYDFRPEQSAALKERIAALDERLSSVDRTTDRAALVELLEAYYSLPADERCYVRRYRTLSDAARAQGVDVGAVADVTPVVESPREESDEPVLLYFSDSDRRAADELPARLTTEQYVTVTTLLDRLNAAEDFDGREAYREKLTAAKETIATIQAEIDALNAEIREKLYPFEKLSLKDKGEIDAVAARYDALDRYDQAKIERWEDVEKAKTKVDNLWRALIIGVALGATAGVTAVFLVRRVRRRRRRRALAMEELARQYADEDDV